MKLNNTGTGYNDNPSLNKLSLQHVVESATLFKNMSYSKVPIGTKFGRLTTTSKPFVPKKDTHVKVICECGTKKECRLGHLRSGKIQSCGCLLKERRGKSSITHGLTKHPLYSIWGKMKDRCNNPQIPCYSRYGGRGIKIGSEWATDFQKFYTWATNNGWQKGLEIDRINNNGNYEPNNCRIVTKKINCRNRRDTVFLTYKGETKSLPEWAEKLNLNYDALRARILTGWEVERALSAKKYERRNY